MDEQAGVCYMADGPSYPSLLQGRHVRTWDRH